MPPDEQDDELKRWLASQQAPSLDAPQPAAAQQPGAWQRAAQMLGAGNYGSEPAPKANDIGWKTVLGMVLSKDPGGVLLADADVKRRQIDDWARRNSPEAMYDRQRQLAGMVMQEDAGKHAAEAQQFEQDRATANDIERAANTEWTHGHTEARDKVGDEQFGQRMAQDALQAKQQLGLGYSRLKQDATQFDAGQAGMDRRQQAQLAAQIGMNDADNARAAELARLKAQGETRAPLPGTHITDPQAYQQFMQSPANVKDITEHVGRAEQVQGYVSQLRALLKADRSAANEAAYNSIIKQLIGDRSQEGSTGVLSNTEFARYIEDLPEYGPMGGFKNWRSALETMQGGNPRLSTLDALDKSLRAGQSAKFGAYGIQMDEPQADDPLLKIKGLKRVSP